MTRLERQRRIDAELIEILFMIEAEVRPIVVEQYDIDRLVDWKGPYEIARGLWNQRQGIAYPSAKLSANHIAGESYCPDAGEVWKDRDSTGWPAAANG
jgi:hypothetical protein